MPFIRRVQTNWVAMVSVPAYVIRAIFAPSPGSNYPAKDLAVAGLGQQKVIRAPLEQPRESKAD